MNFITGATGLVGSHLAKLLLSKGEKVRAIRRKNSSMRLLGADAERIEWMEGDLSDITSLDEAMVGVKKVYHCAAVISFIKSEVPYMLKANVEGTANVMNASLQAGVEKVVHVSSVAAFGIANPGKVIDEKYSDPNINKCFWYFRSKQYGEREAWRAHAEGLPVVVASPGTIIGPGNWGQEPNSLFRDIDKGLRFYTNSTNGFVDVRDVAECLYRLMEGDFNGENYLIVSENMTFKDVMWQIADALQVRRPNWEAGALLRQIAWRAEWAKTLFSKQRPLITSESAAVASLDFFYSNEKIRKALGYTFIPMAQSIKETAAIYRRQYPKT